jgi:flagellar motor protein MotB
MHLDSDEEEGALNPWPAFVDLLAAATLLFVSMVAVFVMIANHERSQVADQRQSLIERLEDAKGNPPLYSVDEDGQFVRVTLQERATFPTRQWGWEVLRDSGRIALMEIGKVLKDPSIEPLYREVRVIGHTDQEPLRGAAMTNWELSAARAAVVARFLIHQGGANPCKISATGRGPYFPVSTYDSAVRVLSYPQRMEKNRRIEIQIVPAMAEGKAEGPPCYTQGDGTRQSQ